MNINPLQREDIPEVLDLVASVFPRDADHAHSTFRAYEHREKDPHWIDHNLTDLRFWVTHRESKIAGVIGLYEKSSDANEACWISWFCVAPEFRKQGIGKSLLEYVITEARRRNKKYLRLYTSDSPEERDAQILYAKFGFKETRRESEAGTEFIRIYRELAL